MRYFAYGSNLDWAQMKGRCPSTRFVAVARLPGYRLAFTRFSTRRRCGAADVVEDPANEVWGALYEIEPPDFVPLDRYEDYVPGRAHNAYQRIELPVHRHGAADPPALAWVYVVCDKSPREHAPNAEYKRLMTGGARHWGLPAPYIALLDAIAVV